LYGSDLVLTVEVYVRIAVEMGKKCAAGHGLQI